MKKKILFIVSNMESGGVSKSMSSLLNIIDVQNYEVDLFITNPIGVFMDLIPSSINIIKDKKTQLLFSTFPNNLTSLLKEGYVLSFFIRIIVATFMLINRGYGAWLLSRMLPKINKKYDLAIDYNGQHQLYYLVDYINAKRKVSFFHSDYSKWDYYYTMDKKYFSKIDKIFTISETCVSSLKKYFPEKQQKINLFENITSLQLIESLANSSIEKMHENALVSIGHLTKNKGTLLAIETAELLKEKGIDFKWYFIGKNSNDFDYVNIIKKKGLDNFIYFIGIKQNPYPYIKKAKVFVHLSRFEGKSIALDEAKLLCKPIVVTNFSTVYDQFENGKNGSICNMNKESATNAIIELIVNDRKRNSYINYLKLNIHDNSDQINKLYKLIND